MKTKFYPLLLNFLKFSVSNGLSETPPAVWIHKFYWGECITLLFWSAICANFFTSTWCATPQVKLHIRVLSNTVLYMYTVQCSTVLCTVYTPSFLQVWYSVTVYIYIYIYEITSIYIHIYNDERSSTPYISVSWPGSGI